ncbi:MAG: DNA-binding protein [Sphingobacteriales bacterium]|nr:MAG: DNA-binding protein [Sphingobacteriales bacterium]
MKPHEKFLIQLTVDELKILLQEVVDTELSRRQRPDKSPSVADEEFFTMKTLPRYIHMSSSKIYKLVSSGKIPHYHCGQKLLFRKNVIDEWMEGQRVI